jgi:transposase InsO family protein
VLGRLRHRRFHGLPELNQAIRELLADLNERRALRRLGRTRRQLLEELDRPALKPLPVEPYVFAEWRTRRVGLDYHVDVDRHYYSVPYRFARTQVEVRLTGRTVELFFKGERIAAHQRMSGNGKHTTVPEQMPSSHRRHADWTIERIRREAAVIGPSSALLCELDFSRPRKSTDNAFIEAFNARVGQECLNASWFTSLTDARDRIEAWRTDYNEHRSHTALGNLTPKEFADQAQPARKVA